MFRTYIKVAWRNLLRDRMYAVVNILGLAVGLAVSIVIFLYIQNELTYDSYNKNADQIYRLGSGFLINGEREQMALSSYALGPALLREMQGVESYCRLRVVPVARFTSPYQKGSEDGIVQADSSLFQMFSYKLLKGNPHTCLSRPLSIVINQKLAQKYFGDNDPMGQIMEGGSKRKYTVTGVMQNLPENTHHYFDGVLSYHSLPSYELACVDGEDPSLWAATDYTFLQLEKGFYAQEFNYEFLDFYKAKMAKIGKRINGYYYPILQPLASIHIGSQLDHDMYDAGNMSYIYGFAAIGLFLLLLAGINYMNMATARSVTRAREVGLRKVMGSRRHHLVFQFLGESMLASLIGLLLALALVEIVLELTPFNDLMGKNLKLGLFQNPMLGFGVLGVTFLLGLGSGLYPAIYLSSFLPVRALRLRNRATSRSISLRKVLVIFQFTVSIGVIIATFLMINQVNYMRNVDLGFNDDNTLILPIYDSTSVKRLPEIRKKIEELPGVIATTTARHVPGGRVGRMVLKVEKEGEMEKKISDFMQVGEDYVAGMGLKILSGTDFSGKELVDSTWEFLVNRKAEEQFFDGSALGKKVHFGVNLGVGKVPKGRVIGVVEDFNVHSLRYEMRPLILMVTSRENNLLHVRIDGNQVEETIAFLEADWKRIEEAGSPFYPFFINEKFEKLYRSDRRLSSLMGILAYICVLISILGLLGFASYAIEQRRKEIGIRKVLGASLSQIVLMLFQEIFYLILVANILGSVTAYLVVQVWLQQFAYQAGIPVGIFIFAGLVALVLAFITVSFHAIRAALANPVHALKYE